MNDGTSTTNTPAPQTSGSHIAWIFGPAFVASVAYVDPGNVAANLTAGARYGYMLVWVLIMANTMSILVQYLSAKLGTVTGKSMPELAAARMRTWPRRLYWLQAQTVAVATDLAEVLGGAIALKILFDLPLLVGGIIVGVVSLALLAIQDSRGQRDFEFVITGLLIIITLGFVSGLFFGHTDWMEVLRGFEPKFDGTDSVLLAVSMLGATVMPHAIYAHSALAQDKNEAMKDEHTGRYVLRRTGQGVLISLAVAGSVNIAMLLLAAGNLYGVSGTDTIDGAHAAIESSLGSAVGLAFAIGLLASSLASTSVGTYSGIVITDGLLHHRIPTMAMRIATLLPAIIIIALGFDPTWSLVVSQVILSMGIPFALIPLVRMTSDRTLMGHWVNRPILTATAWVVVALIVTLNGALIYLTFA